MKPAAADCKVEIHRNRKTRRITRLIYCPSYESEPIEVDPDCLTRDGLDMANDVFALFQRREP